MNSEQLKENTPINIIGHQRILDHFSHVLERSERLAHAYLFVGEDQIGKRTVAMHVAGRLHGLASGLEHVLRSHPDTLLIGNTPIGISDVRSIRGFFATRPSVSTHKVVVIDRLNDLTIAAANALLKTMEEPPAYGVIFLTATQGAEAPATIASRCQAIRFSVVEDEHMMSLAKRLAFAESELRPMLDYAAGRPGRLIDLALPGVARERMRKTRHLIAALPHMTLADRFAVAKKAGAESAGALRFIGQWAEITRNALVAKAKSGHATVGLAAFLRLLLQTRYDIAHNHKPTLLLEYVMLHVDH